MTYKTVVVGSGSMVKGPKYKGVEVLGCRNSASTVDGSWLRCAVIRVCSLQMPIPGGCGT
jgi:hypothetical protein